MGDTVVVGGTSSNGIAEGISSFLRLPLISVERRALSDGESYVRVPEKLAGKNVILVQSTYPPQDKHLIELFLILDAIRSLSPKKIVLVIPYLAYSRQNKRFKEGEPISAEVIIRMIRSAGVDSLITIEPHRPESLNVFGGKTLIVDPIPLYPKALAKRLKNPVVLSPDNGGVYRAERFAGMLNAPFTFIDKERDKTTGEVHIKTGSSYDFKGRDVIIIDDVISTGSTVAQAAQFVKARGAAKIFVVAAHLIMAGDCDKKLKKAKISQVIGLNTIPNKDAKIIDASVPLAEAVGALLGQY